MLIHLCLVVVTIPIWYPFHRPQTPQADVTNASPFDHCWHRCCFPFAEQPTVLQPERREYTRVIGHNIDVLIVLVDERFDQDVGMATMFTCALFPPHRIWSRRWCGNHVYMCTVSSPSYLIKTLVWQPCLHVHCFLPIVFDQDVGVATMFTCALFPPHRIWIRRWYGNHVYMCTVSSTSYLNKTLVWQPCLHVHCFLHIVFDQDVGVATMFTCALFPPHRIWSRRWYGNHVYMCTVSFPSYLIKTLVWQPCLHVHCFLPIVFALYVSHFHCWWQCWSASISCGSFHDCIHVGRLVSIVSLNRVTRRCCSSPGSALWWMISHIHQISRTYVRFFIVLLKLRRRCRKSYCFSLPSTMTTTGSLFFSFQVPGLCGSGAYVFSSGNRSSRRELGEV